jgi:hypothetical protein
VVSGQPSSCPFLLSSINAKIRKELCRLFPVKVLRDQFWSPAVMLKSGENYADCFLRIPQHLLLEASLAVSPKYNLQPVFYALIESDTASEIDERTLLVLTLLLERAKGASSKWAPYIDILPQTYSEHLVQISALHAQRYRYLEGVISDLTLL